MWTNAQQRDGGCAFSESNDGVDSNDKSNGGVGATVLGLPNSAPNLRANLATT